MVDIIGAGRVGTALHARATGAHRAGTLIHRDSGWEALDRPAGAPILVVTRNDDLGAVLARVPAHRHPDLVFVQNGMLRPWLADQGLADVTRGLLFFAVPVRGDDLQPGPEGSPFTGPHARAVVDWLAALSVPARVQPDGDFRALELEKLIWNSAFGLLGQAWKASVGTICDAHADDLRVVVTELAGVGAPALDVTVDVDALLASLCAYSRSIPDFRASVKEWRWRNGWFVACAAQAGVDLPRHAALADQLGVG